MESDALIHGLNGRYDVVNLGSNCMNSGIYRGRRTPE
jgi:hypothetical protein